MNTLSSRFRQNLSSVKPTHQWKRMGRSPLELSIRAYKTQISAILNDRFESPEDNAEFVNELREELAGFEEKFAKFGPGPHDPDID